MRLREWREQLGEWITLPSGLEVRCKRAVTLLDLALGMDGAVPAPLAGVVNQLIEGEEIEVGIEEFAKMAPLINGLVKMALIEPPVADEPDEEHIGVTELPATDRLWLFNKLNEGKQLEKFREGAEESVGTAQSGDGLREVAERDLGARAGNMGGVSTGSGDTDDWTAGGGAGSEEGAGGGGVERDGRDEIQEAGASSDAEGEDS